MLAENVAKIHYSVVKSKAIPVEAKKDPEGSKGSRLPDFMTLGT
jgi:hypothetical protein